MSDEVTPNNDPELRAMLAIIKYFEPLDRAGCARVVEWAKQRYVIQFAHDLDPQFMPKFLEALQDAAKDIEGMTGLDVLHAAQEIAVTRARQLEEQRDSLVAEEKALGEAEGLKKRISPGLRREMEAAK